MSTDNNQFNLDKICRSCLTEDGEMTSMFNSAETEDIRIMDMLQSCAFLQVEEGDGLPSQICLQCYSIVYQAYHFKLQCQKSDTVIRAYLGDKDFKIVKIESVIDDCNAEYVSAQDINNGYEVIEEVTHMEEIDQKIENETDDYSMNYDTFDTDDCKEEYPSSDEIDEQKLLYHVGADNSCPKCLKKFKQEEILSVHLRHCSIHECSVCKKKFRTAGYLQNHMRKHNPDFVPEEKKFKCTECDKSYTSPANLTIHQYSHSGIKPFKCEICGRGFTKMIALNSHLAIHSGKRSHLCSECGRGFTSASILTQHKKIHSGERKFKCPDCSRTFTASGDLTIHMRSHTGEKPYLCTTCGRSFARITHLNTHTRTHTGERPFVCDDCGRGFAQSGDLRAHRRTHTGERPYACHLCSKRFVQSSGLASHMTTHSGVKAFVCNICNRAFSQQSSLARHVKAHM